jgi:hypothetical protein
MPYFKVCQSITSSGPYKWYWSVHQISGHMYHISDGFETFTDCVTDLQCFGELWRKDLI